MIQLGEALTRVVGRPVIDRSGLQGTFNAVLTFTLDTIPSNLPFDALDAPVADPKCGGHLHAIQEQLGLKLEASRAPVNVLVIDLIARPDPD
jgi:uncharacterized protein (TIGR03435 family)